MLGIATPEQGYIAAGCFGVGIGGILTVLPLAWADYFGRASFGAIRGVALTMQVTAQAAGPLISGVLRDLTGTYVVPFACFAALARCSPSSSPARAAAEAQQPSFPRSVLAEAGIQPRTSARRLPLDSRFR